jgi:hypothetical protein
VTRSDPRPPSRQSPPAVRITTPRGLKQSLQQLRIKIGGQVAVGAVLVSPFTIRSIATHLANENFIYGLSAFSAIDRLRLLGLIKSHCCLLWIHRRNDNLVRH